MIILALDTGHKTGWALFDEHGLIKSGVMEIDNTYDGKCFADFEQSLAILLTDSNPSKVVLEKPVFRGANTRRLWGFVSIVQMMAHKRNLIYNEENIVSIKKFITGKGNAKKKDVMKSIENKGYNFADDNEADAIALALYAFEKIEVGQ